MSPTYFWTGTESFRLNASGLKEDTLRIAARDHKTEAIFTLVLPTLCITYADMKFQNAVGGMQSNYPASRAYGPAFFNPPVEITGEKEIERLTYIRGATRVVIGPDETTVEFPSWKELVIPRLRLDQKEPAEATLSGKNVPVQIDHPLPVLIRQFAEGRHVGGVQLQLRHPEYKPPEVEQKYNLWIRVLDARQFKPLVETRVDVWHWDPQKEGPVGLGAFVLDDQKWTDGHGSIQALGRRAGELEAVTAHLPCWRVTPRCFRPLAGQPVRITLRAWPMQPSKLDYVWQDQDTLEGLAALCGCDPHDLLKLNGLPDPSALKPGLPISLPCYAAALRPDPRTPLRRWPSASGSMRRPWPRPMAWATS